MYVKLIPPLRPKDGRKLEIILPTRVSCPGEGKQDIRSLDDQEALLRKFTEGNVEYPVNYTIVAGTGSGENLAREDFERLLELIRTDNFDAVIVEDLARIARRIQAHYVCELCVDHGTRLIALNDNLDTAVPGWEDRSIFSSWHHERANRDTSDRIKRTLANRFSIGGALPLIIFGYEKPPGAKTDEDLVKVPEAAPIYKEWFRRLDEEQATFASIADWLNAEGVPTGPYARSDKWTDRMVARTTRNPLLKGERFHGERVSVRVNDPGVYKSRKAPPEARQTRIVEGLGFLEPAFYDRVIADIAERNSKFRRRGENGRDTRAKIPKKRSRYPGQCIFCGICGRPYVFGGHGQPDHLTCDGARSYVCWNGVSVDGPLAGEKLCHAVGGQIEALEGFDEAFLATFNEQVMRANSLLDDKLAELVREIAKVESEIRNVLRFIREGRAAASLSDELVRLEKERDGLECERAREEARRAREIRLPAIEELKALGRAKFQQLALESYEFAAELRRLTPRIVVYPHQLVDGGQFVLRAKFRLQLAELVPDKSARMVLQSNMERVITLDLFDPPEREGLRPQVVHGRRVLGKSEKEIAEFLGITETAAQNAMALQRRMESLGVEDAYQPVLEPPHNGRLRRHLHRRYRFEPLPDAGIV